MLKKDARLVAFPIRGIGSDNEIEFINRELSR